VASLFPSVVDLWFPKLSFVVPYLDFHARSLGKTERCASRDRSDRGECSVKWAEIWVKIASGLNYLRRVGSLEEILVLSFPQNKQHIRTNKQTKRVEKVTHNTHDTSEYLALYLFEFSTSHTKAKYTSERKKKEFFRSASQHQQH